MNTKHREYSDGVINQVGHICHSCRPVGAGTRRPHVELCYFHSAAPDLLAACRAVRDVYRRPASISPAGWQERTEAAFAAVDAAIAKAEGR